MRMQFYITFCYQLIEKNKHSLRTVTIFSPVVYQEKIQPSLGLDLIRRVMMMMMMMTLCLLTINLYPLPNEALSSIHHRGQIPSSFKNWCSTSCILNWCPGIFRAFTRHVFYKSTHPNTTHTCLWSVGIRFSGLRSLTINSWWQTVLERLQWDSKVQSWTSD